MEIRRLSKVFRFPWQEGWLLLRTLGWCSRPQYWSSTLREEGPDLFFQRHWVPAWAFPTLPARWCSQAGKVLVWPGTKLWWVMCTCLLQSLTSEWSVDYDAYSCLNRYDRMFWGDSSSTWFQWYETVDPPSMDNIIGSLALYPHT